MKAFIHNYDMVSPSSHGLTEVGPVPKGVGLDRIRWDGTKLVDLNNLSEFWVELNRNVFILHVVEKQEFQKVKMTYPERKNLINDNGTFRALTKEELEENISVEQKEINKNNLRKAINNELGDINDQIADLTKLVYGLIIFTCGSKAGPKFNILFNLFCDIAEESDEVYPFDKLKEAIMRLHNVLKKEMPSFYSKS